MKPGKATTKQLIKVNDISEKIGANVTVRDISFAQKLPTRNKNIREKPVTCASIEELPNFKKRKKK